MNKMKMVAATNNAHKLSEMVRILAPLGIELISLKEANINIEPEENADTFAGNAKIKAQAIYEACKLPTVADDSGICVDALGGAPGVYSARYGGNGEAVESCKSIALLLKNMENVDNSKRQAHFTSAICAILDEDTIVEVEGHCYGTIAREVHGEGGFGYDPIFMVGDKSFAQVSPEEKDSLSHRGKSLEKLHEALKNIIK